MVRQTWGNHVMDFVYDNSGKPYALKYDGTTYYYVLNLQGDVMSIITHWGESYGSYTYDAWGNVISQSGSIASINPIRYRGYYYDSETGLYYLGSRYYDPQVRRFINADGATLVTVNPYSDGLTDKNYYAYCNNAPVNSSDDGGDLPTVIVGAIVGGVLGAVDSFAHGNRDMGTIAKDALKGAVTGAIGSSLSGAANIAFGALTGAIDAVSEVRTGLREKKINAAGAVVKVVAGAATGALFSAIGGGGKTEKLSSLKSVGGNIKMVFKNRVKKGTLFKAARNSLKQYGWNSVKQLGRSFVSNFAASGASKGFGWYAGRYVSWTTG